MRQQLREWCYEAEAKRGDQRQAVDPQACFVPLLQWIVGQWQGTPLALALEATTLGTRFTVLAISVVSRGCAMPVAWTILPANQPHAWRREWLRLLRTLRPAIPTGWTVIVLADRGLYAGWLFRQIVRLGWHPFCASTPAGLFAPPAMGASTRWPRSRRTSAPAGAGPGPPLNARRASSPARCWPAGRRGTRRRG